MRNEDVRRKIEELCGEDAYGSWELVWALRDAREEYVVPRHLVDAIACEIVTMIRAGKLECYLQSPEGNYIASDVSLPELQAELLKADDPDPHIFHWFSLPIQ